MWKHQITNITSKTFSKSMYYNGNETRSNLPFQMVLYVNLWLFPAWLLIVIVNLDAKYNNLTSIYKLITVMVFSISSISEVLKLYLGFQNWQAAGLFQY
nr:PREDICTED: transmembrane protein 17B-like isoform X2 [Megachile rotundata]